MGTPALYNRATAVIIQDEQILLLQQATDTGRGWSLPGGKQEPNESLSAALIRETREETGLEVEKDRLLYVADHVVDDNKRVVHITFKANVVGGRILQTDINSDSVPIKSVKFVPINELHRYGFTAKFQNIIEADFPGTGSNVYVGPKSQLGL